MKKKENVFFKNVEIRSSETEEGKKWIEGIIPYEKNSVKMFGTTEIIAKTAFNKTLKDKTTVRALYNHDTNKVLGSTDSGTLLLENTDKGLICRVELPNTSYGNDAFEIINRGDCNTMSFGFIPVKVNNDINRKLRTIVECNLIETSFCVPFPAYESTNSVAFLRGGLSKMNIDINKLNEIFEKETLEDEDILFLKEIIDNLTNYLKDAEAEKKSSTQEQSGDTQEQDSGVQKKGTSESDKNSERSWTIGILADIELLI